MIIYIVRHGESHKINNNVSKPTTFDPPLTKKGIEQSEKLGKYFTNANIKEIYTSPFRRTIQTAVIIGKIIKVNPQIDPLLSEYFSIDLKELKYFEGMSIAKIRDEFPGVIIPDDNLQLPWWPEWPETEGQYIKRIYNFLNTLFGNMSTNPHKILLVTHGAFQEYLYKSIYNIKPKLPSYTAFTILNMRNEKDIEIERFSITPHLSQEDY